MTEQVAVDVAGEDVKVPRPPFRRLRPLLPLIGKLDVDEQPDGSIGGDVDLEVIIDVGDALGAVLFGDQADEYLDRLYSPAQYLAFLHSAMAALQLGEAGASTGT